MVCSFGSGRMAAMARLLSAGRFAQSATEEVGHQKLAAQLVFRELSEAVEPNLLDEEDMHVFGLKPMTDPLHLVCCNTCKKPVKTSQYAAHAEHCRILKSSEESMLNFDGSVRHRKPTRKDRKKSLNAYANQPMSVEELERSVDKVDTADAESQLNGQIGMNCLIEAKNARTLVDVSGVSPDNAYNSISVTFRPKKRSKLKPGEWLQPSDLVSPKGNISESKSLNDCGVEYTKNRQVVECSPPIKDVPAPLATKIYYSQRNNRLRSALCRIYHESAATQELANNLVTSEFSNGSVYQSQTLTQKMDSLPVHPVQTPDQIFAQSSEMCFRASEVCSPPGDFSNQLPVEDIPRPQVAPVGLTRNNYLSKPNPFAGNSGKPLRTVQQQNGSVPVL